jgi:acetyl esterase/lipase
MVSRDADDPLLSRATLAEAATLYRGEREPNDARLTPLDCDISTMPPVRIDVGSAEVLLDDSLRFAEKAERAGLSCEVHVWEGMIHVFPSNFAMLQAAAQAVEDIGSFLAGVLETKR